MPKKIKNKKFLAHIRRTPVLVTISLLVVASTIIPAHHFAVSAAACSSAADCQNQINHLSTANSQAQSSLNGLQQTAASYQDAINALQAQINAVQAQLNANAAQQAALQQQITDDQAQIDHEKVVLGNDLKQIYLGGQISPVEMLATSDNLSDYIDKQQAYSSVQDAIQAEVAKIAAIQKQLQTQKAAVDLLIAEESTQNKTLQDNQYQQSQLLSYNEAQQNQFNAQINSNKAAITALQKQQFLFNVATYGSAAYGGTGGYPWSGAIQVGGTYNWSINGGLYDPLGWNYRNCTSYAFWRLAQARGIQLPWSDFPTVYNSGGRIGYSIPDFQNLGYVVDHNPDGSTLAVSGAGPYGNGSYGHIMFVESSNADSAYVSQYNYAGDGNFSTMTIHSSWQTWFVHIP